MILSRDKQFLIQQIRQTFEYTPNLQKKRDLYRVPEIPIQTTQISIPELKPEDSYSDMDESPQEVESNPSINSKTEPEFVLQESIRDEIHFSKQPIATQKQSKLTEILNQNNLNNPMATQYAQFGAKSDVNAIRISMILPFSEKPLYIQVKLDSTVDDVIGYCLFEYVNEKRNPEIPTSMFTVSKWNIRIVDDGEVDDDFPPLERTRKIQKYAFDQFALIPTQSLEKVQEEQAKIVKGGSTASVFLKIHLYSTLEVKQTTTMQMPLNLTMQEVFDRICRKRKYDSKDYILKMPDTKTDVPMEKTLEQMECIEFCVLKRSSGGAGDIFLRPPEEVETNDDVDLGLNADNDYRKMFKQFNVCSKQLLGKQDRVFTIDGEYLHMDTVEKSLLRRNKALASYPITDLLSCTYSKKSPTNVKIALRKAGDTKIYDLEADSKVAYEIAARINFIIEMNAKFAMEQFLNQDGESLGAIEEESMHLRLGEVVESVGSNIVSDRLTDSRSNSKSKIVSIPKVTMIEPINVSVHSKDQDLQIKLTQTTISNQKYIELNSLNELEKGDLIVVDVVSNIPKPPRNYKTRGISYGNSKIPRLKQKPKRIKRKETFSKPNLLLTPKGLFSQVKKTGDVKVWKREDDGQVIGPILPSLDIRPITKKLVKVIPKQSFNTQPIPRLRYQPLLPQTKNRKHELIQRLKIQQEQLHSRVQESHLVDVNIHRLIKTADVLSLYQFDHFKPEETKPMTALPYIKAQFKNSRRDINTAPIYLNRHRVS